MATEEEEEDDYMSDAFLIETEATKPGLLARKMAPCHVKKFSKERRIKDINERHRRLQKPVKEIEKEKRDEKLNTAIDSSNKGFAMLAKMGFKEGSGLGKHGTGRSEPVPLEIKSDRGGLGREAMLKRRQQMQESLLQQASKRRRQLEDSMQNNFKEKMKEKFLNKQVSADLRKAKKACEQLDSSKNVEPLEPWFWPETKNDEDQETEEVEEDNNTELEDWEMLEKITDYLRMIHLYCIWCGTTYNDADDLNSNCPGNSFESHD